MMSIRASFLGQLLAARAPRRTRSHPPRRRQFLRGASLEALEERAVPASGGTTIGNLPSLGDISGPTSKVDASATLKSTLVDLYKFTVSTQQNVLIDLDEPSSSQGEHFGLALYTTNNPVQPNTAFSIDLDAAGAGGNARGSVPAEDGDKAPYLLDKLAPGTYWVGVFGGPDQGGFLASSNFPLDATGVGFDNPFVGPYTIHVSVVGAVTDPGSTIGDAVNYGPIGSPVTASLESYADVDMYKFTVTQGQSYSFELLASLSLTDSLRLFNAAGNELANDFAGVGPDGSKAQGSGYFERTFTTPGTYYVGVSTHANSGYDPLTDTGRIQAPPNPVATNYKLTIKDLNNFNDTGSTIGSTNLPLARVAAGPGGYNQAIERSTDIDMFKVVVAKAGLGIDITVNTKVLPYQVPVRTVVRLFDSNGTVLAVSTLVQRRLGHQDHLVVRFGKPGTYYFGISWSTNVKYDPKTGNGRQGYARSVGAGSSLDYTAGLFPGGYNLRVKQVK